MINYHKYIFFRLYSWNLKSFGKNDLPALSALLELSLLMFLNLIAADLIFEKLTSIAIINFNNLSRPLIIILSLAVLTANYFILIHNGALKQITSLYQERLEGKQRGDVIFGGYIAISLLGLFLALAFNYD